MRDSLTLDIRCVSTQHIANTPCPPKKEATKLLPITFSNLNRFSKFFHWWIEDEYFQQNCVIFSTTP